MISDSYESSKIDIYYKCIFYIKYEFTTGKQFNILDLSNSIQAAVLISISQHH